jgi:DNA-binding FadR family transcriptional regulator
MRASDATLRALRPTERRKLPHDVADQLLDLIASSAGSEITLPSERALCEQLSVSRNVLREALAALHQAGVIETRGKARIAHVGQARARRVARLPRPSDPVLDPMEVRRILEPEVASLAAKRASPDAVRDMERYVTLMEEAAARGDAVVDYDSAFHVAIAEATGNQTLVALVRALNDALRESRELSFAPESAPRKAIADHVAILDAIREKDPPGAATAMRHHLDRVESLIRDALTSADAGGA